MGWFGSICRGIGRAVGRGIRTVGDFLGGGIISMIGEAIEDKCSRDIEHEDSYDKRSSNVHTTDRLNDVLVSFSEGYFKEATSKEEKCVKLVEEYYDTLIDMVEKLPAEARNNANLRALKNGKKKIAEKIMGGIKDPLAKRMSLDDSRCLEILKMDAGNKKKLAMKKFTREIIKEALENLAKNVKESMYEQTEDIEEYLSAVCEERDKALETIQEQIKKMVDNDEVDEIDKSCINPLYVVAVSDKVSEIFQ